MLFYYKGIFIKKTFNRIEIDPMHFGIVKKAKVIMRSFGMWVS